MQYDMGRFDRPLVDETQPKAHVWTDIGDAEVEHSIFGNAKVRVYRKRDEVRGALGWTLLTVGLVVGAVWLTKDASRQPEIVYVAPPIVVPEPPLLAHSAPVAVVISGESAPAAAKPVPLTAKPAAVEAPVAVMDKPTAPAAPLASKPVVTQTPTDAASAASATN